MKKRSVIIALPIMVALGCATMIPASAATTPEKPPVSSTQEHKQADGLAKKVEKTHKAEVKKDAAHKKSAETKKTDKNEVKKAEAKAKHDAKKAEKKAARAEAKAKHEEARKAAKLKREEAKKLKEDKSVKTETPTVPKTEVTPESQTQNR